MKQQRLILMVVAVGCGLIAAFLASKMSGSGPTAAPQAEIWVASKELTPGTKFTKDSLKDQLKKKLVNLDAIPMNAAIDATELEEKTLTRTLRADDFISTADLVANYQPLKPPAGYDMVSIKLPLDKVTPFVKPTSRIDLLGVVQSRAQNVYSTKLIPDMLVMAVDTEYKPSPDGSGKMAIQNVTLAARSKEAELIRMAEASNVQMSFLLRSDDSMRTKPEDWNIEETIKWVNDALQDKLNDSAPTPPAPTPQPTPEVKGYAKAPVPIEDLPAGTELTAEVISEKFKDADFLQVPDNAVTKMGPLVGQFLQKEIAANQFLPKSSVGKTNPTVKPEPKVEPEPEKPAPPAPPKKRETLDQTFGTATGAKVHRFEKQDNGEWKLVGEVLPDGVIVPVAGAPGASTTPTPEKQNGGGLEPRFTRT